MSLRVQSVLLSLATVLFLFSIALLSGCADDPQNPGPVVTPTACGSQWQQIDQCIWLRCPLPESPNCKQLWNSCIGQENWQCKQ